VSLRVEDAIEENDHDAVCDYLNQIGEHAIATYFRAHKPNRTGWRKSSKPERDLHLARAKAFYRQRRKCGDTVDDAISAMVDEFKINDELARDVARGSRPDVDRILRENPNP
jgi:hypothetical protein